MKLINIAEGRLSEKDIGKITGPIEIRAFLSRENHRMIRSGEASIEVPHGVSMKNRAGSRELEFTCENGQVAVELIDGLDASGISWQEEFENEEVDLGKINEETSH